MKECKNEKGGTREGGKKARDGWNEREKPHTTTTDSLKIDECKSGCYSKEIKS